LSDFVFNHPKKEKPPCIILVCEKEVFENLQKGFLKKGFATLFLDSEDLECEELVSRLRLAINFVQKQKIDKNRIGIVASFLACQTSILLCDKRIKCYVFLNPKCELNETIKRKLKKLRLPFLVLHKKPDKEVNTLFKLIQGQKKLVKLGSSREAIKQILEWFDWLLDRKVVQAVILNENQDKILLVKKRGFGESDYWALPKGKVEKGERIKDALKREIEEEIGLKNIRIQHKIFEYDYEYPPGRKNFVKVYLVIASEREKNKNQRQERNFICKMV
jgi:8-oxo-dGTP diphosphatase